MQALLVHGKAFDSNSKQLCETCKKRGIKMFSTRITDVSASIERNGFRFWLGDRELTVVDFCFLRSFGLGSYEQIASRVAIMEQLELGGALVINSAGVFEKALNKYHALSKLAREKLLTPETFLTETASWAYRKSRKFGEFVYKPIVGSLGFGSIKFNDRDVAFNIFKTLERWEQPLYVQEFLQKPDRDIRVFVLDNNVVGAIYRLAPPDSWKTNVAQGGKAKPLKLSMQLENTALKATKALGLVYAGVDLVETKNGMFLLEVNGAPSWQGLQKATGVNIAERLVQYAVDRVRR